MSKTFKGVRSMTRILINGERVTSTKYIQYVNSIEINTYGLVHELRPKHEVQEIADFIYNCCQKCTGVIMFNNCIIQKEDVRKVQL